MPPPKNPDRFKKSNLTSGAPYIASLRRPKNKTEATSLLGADQEGLGIMEDIQNHQTNASDYYANFFATK